MKDVKGFTIELKVVAVVNVEIMAESLEDAIAQGEKIQKTDLFSNDIEIFESDTEVKGVWENFAGNYLSI